MQGVLYSLFLATYLIEILSKFEKILNLTPKNNNYYEMPQRKNSKIRYETNRFSLTHFYHSRV